MSKVKEEAMTTGYVPNVLDLNCPSRQVLDLIANRWTVLVIKALVSGVKRPGQMQKLISGISPKMLTQTLRALERDGLVERVVFPVVPPAVEYSLTSLGETLIEPLEAVARWAETHLDAVIRARQATD